MRGRKKNYGKKAIWGNKCLEKNVRSAFLMFYSISWNNPYSFL